MKVTDEAILAALLSHSSPSGAAKSLGVSANVVLKRMRDPEFAAEVRRRRAEVLQSCIDSMALMVNNALSVLNKVMLDDSAPHSVRVQACNAILSNYLAYQEHITIASRVQALEEAAALNTGGD